MDANTTSKTASQVNSRRRKRMLSAELDEAAQALEALALAGVPGAKLVYYTGFIYEDREKNDDVRDLAELSWALHKDALVHLFQRRLGLAKYEYIAIRASAAGLALIGQIARRADPVSC